MHCFLGVSKMAPKHKGEMLRLWHRLINMPDNRRTKQIFNWDLSNNNFLTTEILKLFSKVGASYIYRENYLVMLVILN